MLSEAPVLWLLEERWLLKAAKNKCSTRPTEPTASAVKSTNVLSAVFVYLLLGLKTDYKPHFFKAYFCLFVRKGTCWVKDRKLYYPVPRHRPYSLEHQL